MSELGFPAWLRITHFVNILFLTLLIRSGIQILSAHPKLYLNDDCLPDSEWLKLTRKKMPSDQLWTSKDEEESFSQWLALPGGANLGLGRYWHFFAVGGWMLTGLLYVALLFITPQWQRLIPTSWEIVPGAWQVLLTYLSGHVPAPGNPYNPLQQLTYAAVVFLLAPFTIATGAAMSPALGARFSWYIRLFGGHQKARSLHFLSLLAFVGFTIIHTFIVIVHGLPGELTIIVLGSERENQLLAMLIALVGLAAIMIVLVGANRFSLRSPHQTQELLSRLVDPPIRALLHPLTSKQAYAPTDISPFFRVNGRPPIDHSYEELARDNFVNWSLQVRGLVEKPLRLSLAEIKQMERHTQITRHRCIQGWTATAEWTGVPLTSITALCQPLPSARYLVFYAFDEKSVEHGPEMSGLYFEAIDLQLAKHPQTILAYEMNGKPLPIPHGAPLRLRVETQLGFKMVKYLRSIEFVEHYDVIGLGKGGWREDFQHYAEEAGI